MSEKDGWDEDAEFREAPTKVDVPPLPAEESAPVPIANEVTTAKRCATCGQRCIVGGPIVPTIEAMAYASPFECARGDDGDGAAWLWCVSAAGAWQLTVWRRR